MIPCWTNMYRLRSCSQEHGSQLVTAIEEEDLIALDNLLNIEKVDPNLKTKDGLPIQIATVSKCNIQILRLLLDAGADPNGGVRTNVQVQAGSKVRSPLHHCIVHKNLEGVKLLVDRGANVRIGGWRSYPLRTAIVGGDREIIKFLLDSKADINHRNKHGWTPLQMQILIKTSESDCLVDLCSFLIDEGADVNLGPNFPLHCAARYGKTKLAALLLKRDANLLSVSQWKGDTALHEACLYDHGKPAMLELLIRAGIPIESRNEDMLTPLHSAVQHKNIPAVLYLLKAGANVNTTDIKGMRPVYTAAHNHDMKCLNLLLRAGSRVTRELCEVECLVRAVSVSSLTSPFSDYLEYVSSNPPSLRDSCILTIRKILAPRLQTKADRLPLPVVVQKEIALDSLGLDDIPDLFKFKL